MTGIMIAIAQLGERRNPSGSCRFYTRAVKYDLGKGKELMCMRETCEREGKEWGGLRESSMRCCESK